DFGKGPTFFPSRARNLTETVFDQIQSALEVAAQSEAFGQDRSKVRHPEPTTMRVPPFHCTPQMRDALREAPCPQPGETLEDLRQHFGDERQIVRPAQPLSFRDARQKRRGFAAKIPKRPAHGERPAEVERVTAL